MNRSSRASFLAGSLLLLVTLCACVPTRVPGAVRFPGCEMPVFDTSAPSNTSALRPHLDEVSSITGVTFRWVSSAAEAKYGLTIAPVPATVSADVMGSYAETLHGVDIKGSYVVYGSIIRLRPGASAGIRRHELGHLFNLAHNGGSTLMRPDPAGNATWSATERASMRALAVRSGCT